jgi:hypothetical protein
MNNLEEKIVKESVFKIGSVLSVEGRIVKIRVNKNKNHSHLIYKGNVVKNVSVGSYVKIVKGFVEIIGKVEGEFTIEDKFFNKEYNREETKISRTLQVSLFGHFDGNAFKQGIKEMPLIDNECYLLDREEFNKLHKFYGKNSKTVTIGKLTEEPTQEISLSVNKLFASHIGIFGNTGSGKSNTLARIYTELFSTYKNDANFIANSKFVIVDFNGEYTGAHMISDNKLVYNLSTKEAGESETDKYKINKSAIRSLEILSVLLEATEKTQQPFLDRALSNKFIDEQTTFNANVITSIGSIFIDIIKRAKSDLGVSIFLEALKDFASLSTLNAQGENSALTLRSEIENNLHLNTTTNAYYWDTATGPSYDNSQTPLYTTYIKSKVDSFTFKDDELSRIKLKILINFYHEIVKGYSNSDHIRPLIGRMFKKFKMLEKVIGVVEDSDTTNGQGSNLIVVSLRNANIEMKKVLPLIICKYLYDKKKQDDPDGLTSLHMIIDEAHNILSTESQRESETWKDYRLETFEEIIKEGRKFGTFLTVASQRPFDISATIISQLHNYFIHRLINNNDILAIEKTVAYLDKLSFQTIPILSVGSCFIAGLALDVPVKVDIDLLPIDKQPKSETIDLEKAWCQTNNRQ